MRKIIGRAAVILLASCCVVWIALMVLLFRETWDLAKEAMAAALQGKPICDVPGQVSVDGGAVFPPHVRAAFVAAEDAGFYERPPSNPVALLVENALNRPLRRTSPFTLGVVRCVLSLQGDWAGRSLEWHAKGAVLTSWLEYAAAKDLILDSYLGVAPLGSGIRGVDAASRFYFGKTPAALNIAEAAYLAGLAKAPGRFAGDDLLGREQRDAVLARMKESGVIDEAQYRSAVATPLVRQGHL